MLKEVESARQEDPLRHRRWFADDFFDLIVWYDPDGRLDGFQLCYNKSFDEHAFTWRRDSGFFHQRIDDGESVPTKKKSPILVPDGQFPCADIRERFESNGLEMDPKIVRLVTQKLEEFVRGRKPTPPGKSTCLPTASSPDQHENNDRPSETKVVQQTASTTAKKSIVRKGFLVFLTVMGMIGLLWLLIVIGNVEKVTSGGKVEVAFVLLDNGEVKDIRIARDATGNENQKEWCMQAIKQSAPFSPFSDTIREVWGEKRERKIWFDY